MPAQVDGNETHGDSTVVSQDSVRHAFDSRVPALTILAHPVAQRVGARVLLPELISGCAVPLSRCEPLFAQPGSARAEPLEDRHVSRQPISLVPTESGTIRIVTTKTQAVECFGGCGQEFGKPDLERGVALLLGRHVALLLHLLPTVEPRISERFGLIGDSAAMVQLRVAIQRSAGMVVPVLLRGETGTGKELVARAIHQASPRRQGPYLALNLGAVPASLAAAELFGAARGSFTGADRRREGYFERAAGGTLFLDEIGEAPPEVQALLLRTLESGEIQPVGAETPRRVEVRVIAATDAHLENMAAEGRFRTPLLHRLQGHQILLPPLRERRDDIGRLLLSFLLQELETSGQTPRLDASDPKARPFLPARLVARLAAADWPGNVRQLRNVARRLVAFAESEIPAELPAELEAALFLPVTESASPSPSLPSSPLPSVPPRRRLRAIADCAETEILDTLRDCRFNLTRAADRLGISRTVLDGWVERHPGTRKASVLDRDEIAGALAAAGGNLDGAAARLGVSRHGLRLRCTALGIS